VNPIGDAKGFGLNRVRRSIETRPFRSWDDLRTAAATIGGERNPSRQPCHLRDVSGRPVRWGGCFRS